MASSPDVVIIGGGVMGCSVALRLVQAGAQVTLLERSIPGAEASSAAAGILGPQMESDGPGPFLDLCLRSRALYASFSEELKSLSGIDIGYLPSGLLRCAFDEASHHRLEAVVAWQQAYGLRAQWVGPAEMAEFEPAAHSPRLVGAAHFPDDHQVDNRLLVRALGVATSRAGVAVRSGYVRGICAEHGAAVGVDLDGDLLRAGAVVVAAGSWSGLVQGSHIDPRILRPVRGQMLQLQTRAPLFRRVLTSERGYLVPRADGRIIAGSTTEFVGFEKTVTAGGLAKILQMALELCPALEDAPVQEHWAGLRPYTEDHLPILGAGPLDRLFLATGHFRNGILLTPISAQLIAELVLGRKPSLDLRPFRFDRFALSAPTKRA